MKNTTSTPSSNLDASKARERCKENETFFASFIDLVPARIYLNEDDRQHWHNIVANKRLGGNNAEKNGAKNVNNNVEEEEDDEEDIDAKKSKLDPVEHFKFNKFDPKYFKTVSQVLRDLAEYNTKHKKTASQIKQNFSKLKQNKQQLQSGQSKSTALKVLNKSQSSKSAAKNETEEKKAGHEANGDAGKKSHALPAKRQSKFKEEKRAQIKRQRYDSQSEPQIVKIDHAEATNGSASTQNRKPILNKSGQVVFSKFDFTADKSQSHKKDKDNKLTPITAKPKDYKKLLKQLQEKREKIEELKQTEPEKAKEIELKSKWLSVMDKAQGVKPKDDVNMLKKSIKRIEKKKQRSKKGWDERKREVEEKMSKQQEKRRKNLEKKKEKANEKKIKRLKKKGRILPGF